jgi:hypothetical protein
MSMRGRAESDQEPAIAPDGLVRARPGAVGVDAGKVEDFLNDVEAAGLSLHSLVLHRRGHVVVEIYWWPYRADRPRVMHSVAKSFTASAIGIALEEGLFGLSDRVVSFFPDNLPPVVDDKLAAMTVEDLLTMRTGHAEETSGSLWRGLKTSWIDAFFKIPVVYQPGTIYTYTSAASYMLSAILTKATGQTLHDYLRPRLFEPLKITGETWDIGPDGINPGGNGLKCRTTDILKLGVLHAQKGVWNGRRILSEAWVTEATRAHSQSGYGYHWMSGPDGTYSAMGVFVQMVIVFPDHDATLAVTGGVNGSQACEQRMLPLVYKHFPSLFQTSLRDSCAAEVSLERRSEQAALTPPLVSLTEPAAGHAGVLAYRVQANLLAITDLRLHLERDVCNLHLIDAAGEHAIEMGIGRWIEGETNIPGRDLHHGYDLRPCRVVAGARWLDRDTLEMSWIFAETAFRDTVTCRFVGEQIKFSRSVNVNSGPLTQPELIGQRVTP